MRYQISNKIKQAGSLISHRHLHGDGHYGAIEHRVDHRRRTGPERRRQFRMPTVKITNQGTNETRTVQTDSTGRYDAPSLPTGIYKIAATASGFQETTVSGCPARRGRKAPRGP